MPQVVIGTTNVNSLKGGLALPKDSMPTGIYRYLHKSQQVVQTIVCMASLKFLFSKAYFVHLGKSPRQLRDPTECSGEKSLKVHHLFFLQPLDQCTQLSRYNLVLRPSSHAENYTKGHPTSSRIFMCVCFFFLYIYNNLCKMQRIHNSLLG